MPMGKRIVLSGLIGSLILVAGCHPPMATNSVSSQSVDNSVALKKANEDKAHFKTLEISGLCVTGDVMYVTDYGYFDNEPVGQRILCDSFTNSYGERVQLYEFYDSSEPSITYVDFYPDNSPDTQWYWLSTAHLRAPIRMGSYPPSLPSPSPSASLLDLNRDYDAFSPNQPQGDGFKDVDPIHITADPALGTWNIEVEGRPGVLDGTPAERTGSKDFLWNGKVNGIILDDGKYTLRLTAGSEVKTADVIIDTQAPEISNIVVSEGTEPNSYIITASISDKGLSGLSDEDPTVSIEGGNASNASIAFSRNSGTLTYQAAIVPTPSTASGVYRIKQTDNLDGTMYVVVSARDRAGTNSRVRQLLATQVRINARFANETVLPLLDEQSDLLPAEQPRAASTTRVIIDATLNGNPLTEPINLDLTTTTEEFSGGHNHPNDGHPQRPTGKFLLPGIPPTDHVIVTTDASGHAEIPYRCAGFAGNELVTISGTNVIPGSARLRVALDGLLALTETANMHLVGAYPAHPGSHYVTDRMYVSLAHIAESYQQHFRAALQVNDCSLITGGPFDFLYPTSTDPWHLGYLHKYHRNGRSADTPGIYDWLDAAALRANPALNPHHEGRNTTNEHTHLWY